MCGILCELSYNISYPDAKKNKVILSRVSRRGPDCMDTTTLFVDYYVQLYFSGSVLWTQGPKITPQPLESNTGVLLFNGDIFDETWSTEVSDTQTLMNKLDQKNDEFERRDEHIVKVLRSLRGPFSVIYYDKNTHTLYFTRDRIGRSSLLLIKYGTPEKIIICNVLGIDYECYNEGCCEIPAEYIWSLNVEKKLIYQYNWTGYLGADIFGLDNFYTTQKMRQNEPDNEFKYNFDENMEFSDKDNITSFIETTAKKSPDNLSFMKTVLKHKQFGEIVTKVTKLLEESVNMRVKKQPQKCKECLKNNTLDPCNHCTTGILFSGGLDCTILAVLVDKFLPKNQKIDLINVAFGKDDNADYNVPDRLTGRQSYLELAKLCPERSWEFKEVNVPKKELEHYQQSIIADLVYPRKTILDESLGSALWFAARGRSTDNTTSACRILILGSGADELFGGYTRHRNAYKRAGWIGLASELTLDWKRISIRNLSRDNRVICDHGRQPRMPYLDENFCRFVLELQPWFKCFPSMELGPGVGDKLLLRLVALNLGLSDVVLFPKRALQFGSRIANKKEKGSDLSKSFKYNLTVQRPDLENNCALQGPRPGAIRERTRRGSEFRH